MSLLSYLELVDLVNEGVITADLSRVNGSSIDVKLDSIIRVERCSLKKRVVDLAAKDNISTKEVDISQNGWVMHPGDFILASSREVFNLPADISCEYKLKSSMARNGLEHLNAGWCDAHWHGSKLTLELKNMTRGHSLLLREGMAIGQIVFYRHAPVPIEAGYAVKGQYNNQLKVTESKGIQ